MNFILLWLPVAEQELRDLLADPSNRAAVVRAADAIEQELQRAADTAGESRSKGRRIYIEAPLGVTFRVDTRTRIVRVLHVWRFRTGASP